MSEPFKTLTTDELTIVDANRTELTYKKGEILCKEGAFISNTIYIKRGLVKIYLESQENTVILALEKEGYFIGISSLFGNGVYHYTAEALTDTEVCLVDVNVFRNLLKSNSTFACKVLERASEEIVKGYNRIFSLTQKQIHGRFSELLLHLSDHIYHANPCQLTISRKDLADLINTSPESISRLAKEFSEDQIVELDGHKLEILDREKLQMIEELG